MKRSACTVKEFFSRGMACLLAAVMLLSVSGAPGALAESEGLLPESETPVVSNVSEGSTDSVPTGETPEGTGAQTESSAPEAETENLASTDEEDAPVNGVDVLASQTNEELASLADEEDGVVEAADTTVTYEDDGILNGTNWMAGIEDGRLLHEINIPGTHDSGCSEVWNQINLSKNYALTQSLSISKQLNAGVRLFDLRWTNDRSRIKNSSLYALYNCHGGYQTALEVDGVFYCQENGRPRNFENVMNEVRDFLKAHPTETVILNMQSEVESIPTYKNRAMDDCSLVYNAVKNHTEDSLPDNLKGAAEYWKMLYNAFLEEAQDLKDPVLAFASAEVVVAQLAKYIYDEKYCVLAIMKNKLEEEYGDILYTGTAVPALGEVRGKVVLIGEIVSKTGYGITVNWDNDIGTFTSGGVEFAYQNHYKQNCGDKAMTVYSFLDKYNTRLPKAGEHTTRGYISFSSGSKVPFGDNPTEIAETVNPILYNPEHGFMPLPDYMKNLSGLPSNFGELGIFNDRGRHFGWVFSDFVTEDMASLLWHSNFPSGVKAYTVTYKNGEEEIDSQKTTIGGNSLIRGGLSSEQAPRIAYSFTGWKDAETGTVYQPWQRACFGKDTVLEAQWVLSWKGMADAIWYSESGSPITIVLDNDITATEHDKVIIVGNYKNVTIDLNGHTIDANSNKGAGNRGIFRVFSNAALTITDSSPARTGLLTGGYAQSGGAILAELRTAVSLENITIKGNYAESSGGAICLYGYDEASLSLKNVSIVENTAGQAGAGIFVKCDLKPELQGTVLIDGNTLTGASNPVFEGLESNLYVENSLRNKSDVGYVKVSGSLDPESEIGVSLAQGPAVGEEQVISIGLNGNGSVNSFRSDPNRYEILNLDGETVFVGRLQTVNYDPNGATSGTVPLDPNTYNIGDTATVLGNIGNLLHPDGGFIGWNTKADGSGKEYREDDHITVEGSVTLYAQWAAAMVTTQDGESMPPIRAFKDALAAWVDGSTLTLLGDVETDETIYIQMNNSVTLDLNGFGITRVKKESLDTARTVISVLEGGTLTMKDSVPDRTDTGENRPEGVTGGYITGGYAGDSNSPYGGGVKVLLGTFNMQGGTITGNQAMHNGGGVYDYGTFRMSGGAVTGNSSYDLGGGVFVVKSATIEVSGSARIENNTENRGPVDSITRKPSNVYLRSGSMITLGTLESGASFGVKMEEPGVFTTGADFADNAAAQKFFTSDSDAYTVQRSDDGQGTLWGKEPVTYTDHTTDGTTVTTVTGRCEGYTVLGAGNHEEEITLTDGWFVVMDDVTAEKRITVSGTVNLILCDGVTLTAAQGITVNAGDTLNIYPGNTGDSVEGTGTLTANGWNHLPGIGAEEPNGAGGSVSVHGGSVHARGDNLVAAIGGGINGNGGTVTIYDGTVNATGGLYAAGIGGGEWGGGGTVTIYNGTVNATGGMYGAGIGGGYRGDGGDVTVYNGTVTASTESYGAGIGGGGDGGRGGTVTIYGGTVKTNASGFYSSYSEGIGRGNGRQDSGTLSLGEGMYLYGADTANPETDIIHNHIPLEGSDYARRQYMTVNSEPPHSHSLVYSLSEDGATIMARCTTEGCALYDTPSTLTLAVPTETVETEDGETVETDPVYDGTAKSAWVVVGGRTDLWDNVTFAYQKRNPETGAWEALPKISYTRETQNELGEVTETEAEMDSVPIDAGTYLARASIRTGETESITASVEYTIAQRPLTVTAVDQTVLSIDQIKESYSKIRTGDGELAAGQEIFGFYLTPSPTEEGTTEGDIILSNVVVWGSETDVTANYDITCVNGKFYVRENPASVTTAPTAIDNLVYDGNPQELVKAGTADGGTMQYALGTDETTAPVDGWDAEIPTGIGAGTRYVWYMVVGDDTHTDTEPAGPVAVTIGPRIAELTWSDTAFTFNQNAQAPTATVSNLADSHSEADICLVTVEGAQVMPGTYTATATALSNANYALPEENTVEFTIAKYPARIHFAGNPIRVKLGDAPFSAMLIQTWPGEVRYASKNPDIATVDAETGMVTLVGSGEAVITATVEDSDICSYAEKTVSCTVIVSPRTESIRYAKPYVSRLYGSEPFVNPLTNSGDGTVRYSSVNPEIATVDETTGMVTVVSAGEVVIMADVTDEGTSTYSRTTAGYKLEVRKIDNPGFAASSATVKKDGNTVSLADYVRDAEGNLSWSIRGEGLGCTVADDGTFTSGNETGSVKVMVTMSGNKNYLQKSVILTVDVVEKTTRTRGGGAGQTVTYGQALYLTGYVPEGVTPDIHYTGVLRSGVAYDSEETPTEAGTYIATISYEDDEYIWVDRFSASIQPRQLGVPEITLGGTLTYNGSEQTQKVAAVIWDETAVPASEYTVTGNTGTDAGTYTLTITAKPTGNYTGSVTKEFTIGKADPAYTIPTGLTAGLGDTLENVVLPTGWAWGDRSLSVGNELGPQVFKANYTPEDTQNYNTAENIDVTVTVTASAEFSQAPVARENLVFNETLQDLITAGTAVGGTVQYALSTDSPTAFTKDWSEEIPAGTEAGTYYVWYRIVGDESHQDLGPVGPVEVTIAKAEADISYAKTAFEMAYGDAAFTNPLTNTGDGAVSYSSSDSSVATVSDSGLVTIRGLGETTITATATDGTNYSYAIKTVGYTLTVGMSDAVLQLPAFLTRIGEEAFAGTGAVIVEVPENVNAIEARAFADCENLRLIIIPKNVRHVDDTALENCENVTVYGATGSAAQRFARMNGFTFVDPDLS